MSVAPRAADYNTGVGVTTLLTLEEFEALPDEPGKRELLDGELLVMPPPKLRHTKIQHRIRRLLEPYVDSKQLGLVYTDAGYKLGKRHWLQPDVSFVRTAQHESADQDGYLEAAPALAVEVISESNTAEAVDRKLNEYFRSGAEEVWVFYPKTRHVWQYRRGERTALLHADRLSSSLFPDWQLDLAAVFD
jgi:Uma2 family endonuclease